MHLPDIAIETERLVLRVPRHGDFEAYAELMADEDVCRYIGGHMPRAAAWRKFLQMPGAWAMQGFAMFSCIEKTSGEWIGQVGPWQPEGWPGTEVGWSLRPRFWGRGYAFEAGVAAIDWAFDALRWDEVIHTIHPDNRGSIVLAEKLGSARRGPGRLPEPYADARVDIWTQSRAQWRAGRAEGKT